MSGDPRKGDAVEAAAGDPSGDAAGEAAARAGRDTTGETAGTAARATDPPVAWSRWEPPELTMHPASHRPACHYLADRGSAAPLATSTPRRPPLRPYRAALVPFIADQSPTLDGQTSTALGAAAAAIARFDATLRPLADPFAAVLLQAEAGLSARASGFGSGAKTIAVAALGRTRRRHALAVTDTVAAMRTATAVRPPLDEAAVLAIADSLRRPASATWRVGPLTEKEPPESLGTDLAPPVGRQIPDLMADLMRFIDRGDLPVLVRAAIGYAQFLTICPLPAGNGRIGRALIHALLHTAGLVEAVTLPLSASLVRDPAACHRALEQYRGGQPAAVVAWLAEAALEAAEAGREIVAAVHAVRASWGERVAARRGATAWRLADLLVRQPVVSAAGVADALGVAPQNAHRSIAPLAEAGVVTEITGSARHRLWQATEVTAALDNAVLRLTRGSASPRP